MKNVPVFGIAPNAAVFARNIGRTFKFQIHPDCLSAAPDHNLFTGHREGVVLCRNRDSGAWQEPVDPRHRDCRQRHPRPAHYCRVIKVVIAPAPKSFGRALPNSE